MKPEQEVFTEFATFFALSLGLSSVTWLLWTIISLYKATRKAKENKE